MTDENEEKYRGSRQKRTGGLWSTHLAKVDPPGAPKKMPSLGSPTIDYLECLRVEADVKRLRLLLAPNLFDGVNLKLENE